MAVRFSLKSLSLTLFTAAIACAISLIGDAVADHLVKQDQALLDLPGFGPIAGNVETSIQGNTYYSFKGLPYSKAGRFEDFVAPEPWTEVYDATNFGPPCLQPVDILPGAAEDCLYANVYTSNLNADPTAPVLVMVHGGGFVWGDGMFNPVYFMDSNIVVVVFNYRLGPLGFLYSPDESAHLTGNYGLKDQIQLLKWVQQTVSAFGGNPNDVTVQGMSAGAAGVHWLMLMPEETEGLFHKAITMSGTALCPWALQRQPAQAVMKFAKAIGCLDQAAQEPDQAAYDCIRAMDAIDLSISWLEDLTVWDGQPFTFVPAIDGNLIKDDPMVLLEGGNFLQIPWLGSDARDEGALIATSALTSVESMVYLNDNWLSICPFIMEMGLLSTEDAEEACRLAKEHYMGSEDITYDTFYDYLKMAGDRHFDVPLQRSAEFHSKYAPFYGYRYDYQSDLRGYISYLYQDVPEDVPRLKSFVEHADDFVQIILDNKEPIVDGDPDEFVHKFLLGIYLNFINTGVPTIPDTVDYDLEFPTFSAGLPRIQVIDNFPRTDTYYAKPKDIEFWTSLGL